MAASPMLTIDSVLCRGPSVALLVTVLTVKGQDVRAGCALVQWLQPELTLSKGSVRALPAGLIVCLMASGCGARWDLHRKRWKGRRRTVPCCVLSLCAWKWCGGCELAVLCKCIAVAFCAGPLVSPTFHFAVALLRKAGFALLQVAHALNSGVAGVSKFMVVEDCVAVCLRPALPPAQLPMRLVFWFHVAS